MSAKPARSGPRAAQYGLIQISKSTEIQVGGQGWVRVLEGWSVCGCVCQGKLGVLGGVCVEGCVGGWVTGVGGAGSQVWRGRWGQTGKGVMGWGGDSNGRSKAGRGVREGTGRGGGLWVGRTGQ